MWRRIQIRNFRSIEHAEVTLAPFTVVVGPNASGKSNFADAFVFARDIAHDASAAVQSRGGIVGVRRWRPSELVDVTVDVRVSDSREGLETDYARHSFMLASEREGTWYLRQELVQERQAGKLVYEVTRERDEASVMDGTRGGQRSEEWRNISRTTSVMFHVRQDTPVATRHLAALGGVWRLRLDSQAMREPQLATERTRLDESGSNIAMALKSLRQQAEWESVLLAMRKIVPGLRDIQEGALGRYLSMRFFQQQEQQELAEFAATEMSEGAIRALGILAAAQQVSQDELLIIEEPEVSVHPGAATVLFDALARASRRGAVLLTTHSPELLDAAREEEILVCDYRQGITHVGPLDESQRKLVREGLLSAAELMRAEPLRVEGMPPAVIDPRAAS